ncbi:Mss4-like protein [Chaetomium strumarium]|uniref:Mss4-like protein n=1 Tax=Chaetomium strumarium TaxID=1170767 RepID=A0AAJ0LZ28_9PEZI|nr:Mss4-like protein [Chaetomium strumarium]
MEVTCQCKTISFTTPTAEPLAVYVCHCTECRAQSASAFGTSAIFPAEPGLFPLPPELASRLQVWTRPTDSGGTMDCYFCRVCGVRVMHRIRGADGTERETVSIKGGLVKGLSWKGAAHIFTRSAVVDVPEGVERWEGAPDVMPGRKSTSSPEHNQWNTLRVQPFRVLIPVAYRP